HLIIKSYDVNVFKKTRDAAKSILQTWDVILDDPTVHQFLNDHSQRFIQVIEDE
ncbi:28435_t:CDS:2, partial [Racocetra persica]